MAFLIGLILVLPLFPAEPKLGPVFQQVTRFIPLKFSVQLIAPAVLLDLLWSKFGEGNKLLVSIMNGPLFVLGLVAIEWPFARFLMPRASQNWLFATGRHDYGTPSWSAEVTRRFISPEHEMVLWGGLAQAAIYATVSVWLGLLLGDWMRKIVR